MGRLIEGGGVGRPDGKNLQILDLYRLASLHYIVGYIYVIYLLVCLPFFIERGNLSIIVIALS